MRHGHESRGCGSFDASRDWHAAWGGFACGSRWCNTKPKVNLHTDWGGFSHRSRWFYICMHPEAIRTVQIRGRFGNCAKKGILSPVSEIYRVYTQKSRFFARILNPASVFSFSHPDRKVLTEPSRYTERYPCSYLKVSEFHLTFVVEVCYCIWQT